MPEPRPSSLSDQLSKLLDEWSTARVESVARRLNVRQDVVERLCRESGATVVERAGATWVYGRQPRRTVSDKPAWARGESP